MNIFFILFIIVLLYWIAHSISLKVYGYSLLTFSQTAQVGLVAQKEKRIASLTKAKDFLGPYSDIWGDFSLSNRFCSVRLDSKNKKVYCKSKLYDEKGRKHYFVAEKFDMIHIDDYWNTLCDMFTMQTNYQQVFNSCKTIAYLSTVDFIEKKEKAQLSPSQNENFSAGYNVNSAYTFKEFYTQIASKDNHNQIPKNEKEYVDANENDDDLLDINNASEAEITELPGINIVIAKKIVKERTEKGAFKSKQDFFERINMKSHFAEKIQDLICIKEINIKSTKRRNTERIVDFE